LRGACRCYKSDPFFRVGKSTIVPLLRPQSACRRFARSARELVPTEIVQKLLERSGQSVAYATSCRRWNSSEAGVCSPRSGFTDRP
jgi:hypothetical protein